MPITGLKAIEGKRDTNHEVDSLPRVQNDSSSTPRSRTNLKMCRSPPQLHVPIIATSIFAVTLVPLVILVSNLVGFLPLANEGSTSGFVFDNVASPSQPVKAAVNNHFTVYLLGDSLVGIGMEKYDLLGKVRRRTVACGYNNASVNGFGPYGAVVKDWRNPSVYLNDLTSILSTRPDVVLIYWDSDCIMDHDLSETAATQLRTNYTANLRWLVETILDSTTFLSIGGPGLYGTEGWWPSDSYIVWDMYRDMNKAVVNQVEANLTTSSWGSPRVDYMDVRAALMADIPWYWVPHYGYVTKDGEHPNERGARVTADVFAAKICMWLDSLGSGEI